MRKYVLVRWFFRKVELMAVISQQRLSDSPFVETVWQVQAVSDGCDTVIADVSWDMIIFTRAGRPNLTIWGPMTRTAQISHMEGQSALGIRFKLGTFMPVFPTSKLLNAGLLVPQASRQSVWLGGRAWELPTYENVDTFVDWLVRDGLLLHDPVVDAVMQGHLDNLSVRSVQRRFLQATGLNRRSIRQIERAQQAAALLKRGLSILDTVHEAGYFDQAHLTKALRRFIGQTPAQLLSGKDA
jgi:hypothetical protein